MRIYHYTNIETLALILKNKTIRFNRLDHVDDLEEGHIKVSGIKPGLYSFVSCWTENSEESIPLWRMYTDKGVGVRIGMDKEMFKKYTYHNGDIIDGTPLQTDGTLIKPISPEKLITHNMWVLPNFNDGVFFRKVQYVDDVTSAMKNAVQRTNNQVNKIETSQWSLYKNKRWEFQNESRFALTIFPKPSDLRSYDSLYCDWLRSALNHEIPAPVDYYDLDLDADAFNGIDITLCPNMSEGNKIIVESLCYTYLDKIHPKESSLNGFVKLK